MKFKTLGSLAVFSLTAIGCATGFVNNNPNILAEDPYSQVKFVAKPAPGMKKIRRVKVTKRGMEANILNSIPAIYKRAIKEKKRFPASRQAKPVYLGNIKVRNFTKREPFQVPYQKCRNVSRQERVPQQQCRYVSAGSYGNRGSYGTTKCTTTYRMQTVNKQECTTHYKTEIRDVLYQTVSADVYK